MPTPEKGTAYEFYLPLVDVLDGNTFLIDPSMAAGDWVISLDGGAQVNLSSLPVVAPAGSSQVQVNLTAAEMDADKVVVTAIDQAGLWEDVSVFLDNPVSNISEIAGRLDLDVLNPNTYSDDAARITSNNYTLDKVDNGDGTFTVVRS